MLVAAGGAAAIGRGLVDTSADSSGRSTKKKSDFVRFEDGAGQLSIAYPSSWRRLSSLNSDVRLLVAGQQASLLVREVPLGIVVDAKSIGRAKRITDNAVRRVSRVQLLRRARRVSLGGLQGYLYLYTFRDGASGRRGAHAHYFLFRGDTMITLVFQTLPAQRFGALAPLFDRIAKTFRAEPAAIKSARAYAGASG